MQKFKLVDGDAYTLYKATSKSIWDYYLIIRQPFTYDDLFWLFLV